MQSAQVPTYQVTARKYRPQQFNDVVGQDALVTTLRNAIKFNRLAHAYLFCGSRGCGKTSIARILAKALNCQNLSADFEPCNQCPSCKEIMASCSIDVLEIDGASNRGIDDIRTINETVNYTPSSGKYKIYLIDEVHMLTKEAFNALLKTLEEPPATVKFFFATTEPHKIPATILSRCQRFQLSRIPLEKIAEKLRKIAYDSHLSIDDAAIYLIAKNAEGSLRDAESLFDQITSFQEGPISIESVTNVLGFMPSQTFFELDIAGVNGNLAAAFDITHKIFLEGKDLFHFVDSLIEHFRNLLLTKISSNEAPYLLLAPFEKDTYLKHATYYSQEQCLNLLDFLIEARQQIKASTTPQIALEAILLHILRSHKRICIETLTKRLIELEHKISPLTDQEHIVKASQKISKEPIQPPSPEPEQPPKVKPEIQLPPEPKRETREIPLPQPEKPKSPPPELGSEKKFGETKLNSGKEKIKGRDETIMRFAAIELEGSLKT